MPLELILALILFSAGLLQGLAGFGAALLAMPLLVLVLDVKEAVTLTLLSTLIINLFLSVQLKSHLDWRKILPLVVGCVPGVYLGVTLLAKADPALIKCSLGVLITSYALYCLGGRLSQKPISKGWGYVAGFATGTINGAFSAGGPPTIIYTTLTGWKKDEIKATLSCFFLFTTSLAVIGHFFKGLATPHVLRLYSLTALPVLAGVFLGTIFYKRLKSRAYLTMVYYLLIGLGLMMIVSGLR